MTAYVPISALPGASALAGAEEIPVLQGGTSKQTTPANVANLAYAQPGAVVIRSRDNAGLTAHGADKAGATAAAATSLAGGTAAGTGAGGDLLLDPGASVGGAKGLVLMTGLPTADPGVSGALWVDPVTRELRISPYVASAPAWVTALRAPSGDLPLVVLDWKNGRYWAGGAVQANADAVVEDCPAMATGWNSAMAIVPGSGLQEFGNISTFQIKAAFAGGLLGGLTVLIVGDLNPANSAVFEIDLFEPTFAFDRWGALHGNGDGTHLHGTLNDVVNTANIVGTGNNAVAFNITHAAANMDLAIDGGGDITQAQGVPAAAATLVADFTGGIDATSFSTLMAFYAPQPAADLGAISLLRN